MKTDLRLCSTCALAGGFESSSCVKAGEDQIMCDLCLKYFWRLHEIEHHNLVTTLLNFSRVIVPRDEPEIHKSLVWLFTKCNLAFTHEAIIGKDKFDFLIGGTVIEVKTSGAVADIIRQLHRYAQRESVKELVLFSSKNSHRQIPGEINGKPVHIIILPERF